ncbi:MAG: hypothetical protein RBU45_05775 [Myxococcota bacterium]|jgi:hypothetical protein|nr:hypothetical protein [Myxococcota bacterium]
MAITKPATPLLLLLLGLGLVACGEVKTLDNEFKPSLSLFSERVQPVLDAQTCGRGPDEERGTAGCHTPEQGGLRLFHRPTPEQVVLNYREAVALIRVDDPAASPLLLAPLNGPLPKGAAAPTTPDAGSGPEDLGVADLGATDLGAGDAGAEIVDAAGPGDAGVADGGSGAGDAGGGGEPRGAGVVDHPEYAGRFTSPDDCCYCAILLWICSARPENATLEACQRCQALQGCDTCQPVVECTAGGAPEQSTQNATVFTEVTDILVSRCGSCHGLPPALQKADDVRAVVAGTAKPYLTPCAGGGLFLRYVDGNANDGLHSGALDAEQRGKLHVWIEELGAPTNSLCVAGGTGAAEEATLFQEVVTLLTTHCGGCHGVAPLLAKEEDIRALLPAGDPAYLTPCAPGSLLMKYVEGNEGDPLHANALTDEAGRATIRRWIEQAGAPMP